MGKTKPFINKKQSVTFYLTHNDGEALTAGMRARVMQWWMETFQLQAPAACNLEVMMVTMAVWWRAHCESRWKG